MDIQKMNSDEYHDRNSTEQAHEAAKNEWNEQNNPDLNTELDESSEMETSNLSTDDTKQANITSNSAQESEEISNIPKLEEILKKDLDTSKTRRYESFADCSLHESTIKSLNFMGWNEPSPIQSMTLPYTLEGRDVAGFAQTGTGKTGVFLVTIGNYLFNNFSDDKGRYNRTEKGRNPLAVLITPTRELAMQIEDNCNKFFKKSGINALAVYGGSNWESQAKQARKGVDILVATPGRLIDFHEKGVLQLDQIAMLVCDEADRMFEMGFIKDVEYFLENIPSESQKLLFSATTNDKVKELAFEYLDKPIYISLNKDEVAPENIEQHALVCELSKKLSVLLGLLRQENPNRAVIFANTKLTAAWLQYKLNGNGFKSDLITGDLSQNKRINLIKNIQEGKINLLIATDVASRGLHIADITHVFNFDIPDDSASYVHRIGRTARAGAYGKSYSLVCDEYGSNFENIQILLGKYSPSVEHAPDEFLAIEDHCDNPFENGEFISTFVDRDKRGGADFSSNRGRGPAKGRSEYQRGEHKHKGHHERHSYEQRDSGERDGPRVQKKYQPKHTKKVIHREHRSDHKHREEHYKQHRPDHKQKALTTAKPKGVFAIIKRFFALLFGGKK